MQNANNIQMDEHDEETVPMWMLQGLLRELGAERKRENREALAWGGIACWLVVLAGGFWWLLTEGIL